MKKDYTVRRETAADYREVENLTREAFWNVYRDVRNITYFIGSVTDRSLSKNSIYVWRSADESSVM